MSDADCIGIERRWQAGRKPSDGLKLAARYLREPAGKDHSFEVLRDVFGVAKEEKELVAAAKFFDDTFGGLHIKEEPSAFRIWYLTLDGRFVEDEEFKGNILSPRQSFAVNCADDKNILIRGVRDIADLVGAAYRSKDAKDPAAVRSGKLLREYLKHAVSPNPLGTSSRLYHFPNRADEWIVRRLPDSVPLEEIEIPQTHTALLNENRTKEFKAALFGNKCNQISEAFSYVLEGIPVIYNGGFTFGRYAPEGREIWISKGSNVRINLMHESPPGYVKTYLQFFRHVDVQIPNYVRE